MKVLLIKEVPGFGHAWRCGRGPRRLCPKLSSSPKSLRFCPTPHELSRYEKLKARYEAEITDRRAKAQAVAEKLRDMEFVFSRRVHDKNKLYAAVQCAPTIWLRRSRKSLGEEIPPLTASSWSPSTSLALYTCGDPPLRGHQGHGAGEGRARGLMFFRRVLRAALGTGFSRLTGLLRDAAIAYAFGASASYDAFLVGLFIPQALSAGDR
jgi:hypothetical protein